MSVNKNSKVEQAHIRNFCILLRQSFVGQVIAHRSTIKVRGFARLLKAVAGGYACP